MKIEKYSPKWLLEKINASKTDAYKLMHIIEYRKELVESTEKQLTIHSVVKSSYCECTAPIVRTSVNMDEYCGNCGKDIEQ